MSKGVIGVDVDKAHSKICMKIVKNLIMLT